MLARGSETFNDVLGGDPLLRVLTTIDDDEIENDRLRLETALYILSRNIGTTESEIKEEKLYNEINDEDLFDSIATFYLMWKDESNPVVEDEYQFISHVQTRFEASAEQLDVDIEMVIGNLIAEEFDIDLGKQCFALQKVIDDEYGV